ncbi:hypothetical protein ACFPM0_02280 [Pseudonocardia sulfidoxydans]|uniref:hypothetical protein n=1 Tax=Pseudonocardia sulfidoxydans TaxID=54011 RepID=UPI0036131560
MPDIGDGLEGSVTDDSERCRSGAGPRGADVRRRTSRPRLLAVCSPPRPYPG